MTLRAMNAAKLPKWFALYGLLAFVPQATAEELQGRPGQTVINFEDFPLAPESYNNGSDGSGGFTLQGTFFNNSYNPTWDSWSGWSISNTTDTTTPGFMNQYSAYPGTGAGGSSTYGVAFTFSPGSSFISLPAGFNPLSAQITNTTYAVLSMLSGDQFAKKFGGPTGTDPDFLLLSISGFNDAGVKVGGVEFYLADYRFSQSNKDYIVTDWTTVDLRSLRGATSISFSISGSDTGPFGLNTPAYFALDNLVLCNPAVDPSNRCNP